MRGAVAAVGNGIAIIIMHNRRGNQEQQITKTLRNAKHTDCTKARK